MPSNGARPAKGSRLRHPEALQERMLSVRPAWASLQLTQRLELLSVTLEELQHTARLLDEQLAAHQRNKGFSTGSALEAVHTTRFHQDSLANAVRWLREQGASRCWGVGSVSRTIPANGPQVAGEGSGDGVAGVGEAEPEDPRGQGEGAAEKRGECATGGSVSAGAEQHDATDPQAGEGVEHSVIPGEGGCDAPAAPAGVTTSATHTAEQQGADQKLEGGLAEGSTRSEATPKDGAAIAEPAVAVAWFKHVEELRQHIWDHDIPKDLASLKHLVHRGGSVGASLAEAACDQRMKRVQDILLCIDGTSQPRQLSTGPLAAPAGSRHPRGATLAPAQRLSQLIDAVLDTLEVWSEETEWLWSLVVDPVVNKVSQHQVLADGLMKPHEVLRALSSSSVQEVEEVVQWLRVITALLDPSLKHEVPSPGGQPRLCSLWELMQGYPCEVLSLAEGSSGPVMAVHEDFTRLMLGQRGGKQGAASPASSGSCAEQKDGWVMTDTLRPGSSGSSLAVQQLRPKGHGDRTSGPPSLKSQPACQADGLLAWVYGLSSTWRQDLVSAKSQPLGSAALLVDNIVGLMTRALRQYQTLEGNVKMAKADLEAVLRHGLRPDVQVFLQPYLSWDKANAALSGNSPSSDPGERTLPTLAILMALAHQAKLTVARRWLLQLGQSRVEWEVQMLRTHVQYVAMPRGDTQVMSLAWRSATCGHRQTMGLSTRAACLSEAQARLNTSSERTNVAERKSQALSADLKDMESFLAKLNVMCVKLTETLVAGWESEVAQGAVGAGVESEHEQAAVGPGEGSTLAQAAVGLGEACGRTQGRLGAGGESGHEQGVVGSGDGIENQQGVNQAGEGRELVQGALGAGERKGLVQGALGAGERRAGGASTCDSRSVGPSVEGGTGGRSDGREPDVQQQEDVVVRQQQDGGGDCDEENEGQRGEGQSSHREAALVDGSQEQATQTVHDRGAGSQQAVAVASESSKQEEGGERSVPLSPQDILGIFLNGFTAGTGITLPEAVVAACGGPVSAVAAGAILDVSREVFPSRCAAQVLELRRLFFEGVHPHLRQMEKEQAMMLRLKQEVKAAEQRLEEVLVTLRRLEVVLMVACMQDSGSVVVDRLLLPAIQQRLESMVQDVAAQRAREAEAEVLSKAAHEQASKSASSGAKLGPSRKERLEARTVCVRGSSDSGAGGLDQALGSTDNEPARLALHHNASVDPSVHAGSAASRDVRVGTDKRGPSDDRGDCLAQGGGRGQHLRGWPASEGRSAPAASTGHVGATAALATGAGARGAPAPLNLPAVISCTPSTALSAPSTPSPTEARSTFSFAASSPSANPYVGHAAPSNPIASPMPSGQQSGVPQQAPRPPLVQSSSVDHSCVVCMERRHTEVLVPCGHVVLCTLCCEAVCAANNECPMCREDIIAVVHLQC